MQQSIQDLNTLKQDMAASRSTATAQPAATAGLPAEFKPQFDQTSLQTLGGKEDWQWGFYGRELSKAIYSVNQQLDHAKERPQEYAGFNAPIPQPPVLRSDTDVSKYTDALKQWSKAAFDYAEDHDPQMIALRKQSADNEAREKAAFAGARDAVSAIGKTSQNAASRVAK